MQSLMKKWNSPQSCYQMLGNMLNLNETELNVYRLLLSAKGKRVSEIAMSVGRDRSLVQKALQNLMSASLVTRKTEKIRNGGYCYTYDAVSASRVKKELAQCIEDWHESLLDSLSRFDEEMEGSVDG